MLAAICSSAGYRTGLYTSPHLVKFNERILVNGQPISDKSLAAYTRLFKKKIVETKATFFEATTAIAFQYFADQKVDIAIIETGLGGRYDATNVLTPLLSIITTIGFDHTEQLGNTLAKIAYEKGGIIKNNIPCVTGVTQIEARDVLKKIAKEKNAPLLQASKLVRSEIIDNQVTGLRVNLKTREHNYKNITVSLSGEHQAKNLQLAILAAEYLMNHSDFKKIDNSAIQQGLKNIQSLSGFHGRLEVLQEHPLLILDVAHNPDGISAAIKSLHKILVNKPVIVFGVMKDKEYRTMISSLSKFARIVITVEPKTVRALSSKHIVEHFHALGFPAIDGKSVTNGTRLAHEYVRSDEAIVVLGSHYVAGEVMEMRQKKKPI